VVRCVFRPGDDIVPSSARCGQRPVTKAMCRASLLQNVGIRWMRRNVRRRVLGNRFVLARQLEIKQRLVILFFPQTLTESLRVRTRFCAARVAMLAVPKRRQVNQRQERGAPNKRDSDREKRMSEAGKFPDHSIAMGFGLRLDGRGAVGDASFWEVVLVHRTRRRMTTTKTRS